MQANFDLFDFVEFLRQRWRVPAIACLVALAMSLGVSLILPKRYTASASIVIEPPGGVDSRTATAVSPVYLESLKTYERFAGSDSLFALAAERFHLDRSRGIESLKQRVLKVTKLRDTKILVIDVTLSDPQLAHGVAEYLAQQTAEISRSESLAADADLIQESQRQAADSRLALERAQKAWEGNARLESADSLQADLDGMHELQLDVQRQLSEAQIDAAEYRERVRGDTSGSGGSEASRDLSVAIARVAALEIQSANLARAIAAKSTVMSARKAEREKSERDLDLMQTQFEAAAARLRDVRASAGSRGERLRVIDPGIVPQRPTSPNLPLNILAAVFLALVISVAGLSAQFAYRRRTVEFTAEFPRRRRAG
jgi:capsular polysaccharide biosynthesis protein